MEQEDAQTISEGEEVTLMDWGNAIVQVPICHLPFPKHFHQTLLNVLEPLRPFGVRVFLLLLNHWRKPQPSEPNPAHWGEPDGHNASIQIIQICLQ